MKSTLLRPLQLIVAICLLSSCNSFNTINEYSQLSTAYSEAAVMPEPPAAGVPASAPAKAETLCPAFQLPEFEKTPELPIRELQKIRPGDNATLDAVVQKHIRELRSHISKTQSAIAKAHSDYIKSCKSVFVR